MLLLTLTNSANSDCNVFETLILIEKTDYYLYIPTVPHKISKLKAYLFDLNSK